MHIVKKNWVRLVYMKSIKLSKTINEQPWPDGRQGFDLKQSNYNCLLIIGNSSLINTYNIYLGVKVSSLSNNSKITTFLKIVV